MLEIHRLFIGDRLIILNHGSEERGDIIHHTNIGILESPLVFFSEEEVPLESLPCPQGKEIETVIFIGSEDFSGTPYLSGRFVSLYLSCFFLVDGPDRGESRIVLMDEESRNSGVLLYRDDVIDIDGF